MIDDDKPWFRPKSYGYGAGVPIAWQGWAAIGLFIAALVIAGLLLMPGDPIAFAAVALILSGGLTILASCHTQGGWRWRWGDKD